MIVSDSEAIQSFSIIRLLFLLRAHLFSFAVFPATILLNLKMLVYLIRIQILIILLYLL